MAMTTQNVIIFYLNFKALGGFVFFNFNILQDYIDGGLGIDVIVYQQSPTAVRVNLSSNETHSVGKFDVILNIENVVVKFFKLSLKGKHL